MICSDMGNGMILGEAGDFAVVVINECWFWSGLVIELLR